MVITRKVKNCKWCGNEFTPFTTIENTCSWLCEKSKIESDQKNKPKKKFKKYVSRPYGKKPAAKKTDNKQSKIPKRGGVEKPRKKVIDKAQEVTNRLVKLKQWGEPCTSCGTPHRADFEAGHYHSVGAYPECRLNLTNIHVQCVECNHSFTNDLKLKYKRTLLKKYGSGFVRDLENLPLTTTKIYNDDIIKLTKARKIECERLEREIKLLY